MMEKIKQMMEKELVNSPVKKPRDLETMRAKIQVAVHPDWKINR